MMGHFIQLPTLLSLGKIGTAPAGIRVALTDNLVEDGIQLILECGVKETWREVFRNLPESASPEEKRKLVLILSFMAHSEEEAKNDEPVVATVPKPPSGIKKPSFKPRRRR